MLLAKETVQEHKIIGQLFDTYWLVEFNEQLYIIDQHAAHERILFNKLKSQSQNSGSQMLLAPVTVTLGNIFAEE